MIEDLPTTAPHFIGLIAALVGAGLVLTLMRRPSLRERLGNKRMLVTAALFVGLTAVGLFGNGVYGTAGRGTAWTGAMLSSKLSYSSESVEQALKVGLSDEFIRYHGALSGEEISFASADFGSRLRWEWVPYADAGARYGIHVTPLPPAGQMLIYHYQDTHNFLFHLLGIGEDAINQRFMFWQDLVHKYLDELVALEHLKHAASSDERVAALVMLRFGVPSAAEWILRELGRISDEGMTAEVRTAVEETRAYVQNYIEHPEHRALRPGPRIQLSASARPTGEAQP